MSTLSVFHGAKVLFTGHTGFKGAWLSLWLTQLGVKFTGVSFDVPSVPSQFVASNLANCVDDVRLGKLCKSLPNSYCQNQSFDT